MGDRRRKSGERRGEGREEERGEMGEDREGEEGLDHHEWFLIQLMGSAKRFC